MLGAWFEPGGLAKGIATTRLRLFVVGLVDISANEELNVGMRNEVVSDTQLILMDVFAQLYEYFDDNSIVLNKVATLEIVEGAWDDNVYGWQSVIEINQFYARDTCQVPGVIDAYLVPSFINDPAFASNSWTIPIGQESNEFYITAAGLVPTSGNITILMSGAANFEIWDGAAWSHNDIVIPYTSGAVTTAAIYKLRPTGVTTNDTLQITGGQFDYSYNLSTEAVPEDFVRIIDEDSGDTLAYLVPPQTYTVKQLTRVLDTITANQNTIIDNLD